MGVFEFFTRGGYLMIPLVLLSFITFYFGIERWLMLRTLSRRDRKFIDTVTAYLGEGKTEAAKLYAENNQTPSGKMITAGLDFVGRPYDQIESAMESSAELEIGRIEKNIRYLGIIAGVAPMMGFIGTISGIIKIFYDISISNNISMDVIAGGLYEKLITSFAGLTVGVLAFIWYHLLGQGVQSLTLSMQEDAMLFMKRLNAVR